MRYIIFLTAVLFLSGCGESKCEECETNCATDLNLGDSDVYWRCVERVCKNVCDAY